MTDQQHAAAEPDPGPGPGAPPWGAGPRDAAPPSVGTATGSAGAAEGAGAPGATGEVPRAHGEPPAPEGPRRFRRDRRQKMLGGVCAGLGRQCDMDPVIFRIVLAVLSATGGIGLIFYGFVWLFVPYNDEEENEVRKLLTDDGLIPG